MPKFTSEQQEAIDIEGSNVLVSAGAGSGKTEVLSQRVLRKILSGVSIDNLLVLTFTNAAAAEMKVRIRDKIGSFTELKEEFDKVEASYIITFDAFTLAIVKKYHYLKNLSKDINICDSSIISLKKAEILDSLFINFYENEDTDFLDLIRTYSFKNDDEVKEFVRKCQNDFELFYNKKEFMDTFIDTFYSENKLKEFTNKYESLVLSSLDDVKLLYNNLYLLDEEYILKSNLSGLMESKNYVEVFNNFDKKLPNLPKNSDDELKNAKTALLDSLKNLEKYLKKESLEEYIIDYKKTKKCSETFIKIIKIYDAKVEEFKYKNNLFEFLDIEKLAIDILRENEDVRLYYKERFNEILIDEYQDTSDLQEIFVNLICKENVYMVGDIKQSIYRFRNANPDIFRDKFNNYGKNVGGKRVDLNKNFRSRKEVLDNINLIFNFLMDDKIGGADYEKEHKLIFGNLTYENEGATEHSNDFEVLNYEVDKESKYKAEEIEIFTMADDISKKINDGYLVYDRSLNKNRKITYDDFAILIDKSKNFDLIKKIFNYKNIPLMVYKDESIKDSINIKIIKNILILINNANKKTFDKTFSYAFTSVARSYLFRLEDEDIFDIIKNKNFFETEIYKKIKTIINKIDEKNIYNILKEIIVEFDFYNKIITVGGIDENNAVIEYILDLCKQSATLFSLEDFINYLDNITYGDIDIKYSLSKGDAQSVKLMTIHRSKGLEYPVVYFPSLKNKFNQRDILNKFTFNKNLGFIIPFKNEFLESVFTKEILKNEFLVDDISEKLRLFYVALTRAREKFIFIMNFENKKDYQLVGPVINNYERMKYRSFKDFLESVNKVLVKYTKNINLNEIGLTKDYDLVKKSNYLELLDKTDEVINAQEKKYNIEITEDLHFSKTVNTLFSENEKKNINDGLILHKVMEDFDFEDKDLNLVDEKYRHVVENFLNTKIMDNYINIYKEYEFMYEEDTCLLHGIIDLLIEKENEFVIIDYKLSNIKDDAYLKQLNGYKNYIENISNKKTKIYLYSLVKNELVNLEDVK